MNKKVLISTVIVLALAILGSASYYIFSVVGADTLSPTITKGVTVRVLNNIGKTFKKSIQVRPTVYVAGKYKKKDSTEIKWFFREVTLPVKNVVSGGSMSGTVRVSDTEFNQIKSQFAPTITVSQ